MEFKDVATIFSRAFIVGFYLPAFFALFLLWQLLPTKLLPAELVRYPPATQLVIIAGLAILLGLLLSGLNYSVLRLFEGYPLQHASKWPVIGLVHNRLMKPHIREFRDLTRRKREGDSTAAWKIDRRYPSSEAQILPTRFGNAVRAFEHHALVRWGLSTVGIWPRVELLLSQSESEVLSSVKSDADFLVNASLMSYGVGVVLVVDAIILQTPSQWYAWALYAFPLVVGYLLYRAAVGAAVRWGSEVRSCVDLHRLELYERMGLQRPNTHEQEMAVADALNQCLLYGTPIPDAVRATSSAQATELLALIHK